MGSVYNVILKIMPERRECPVITFRQAGDGFLEVCYGQAEASSKKTIRDIILRAIRVIIINKQVKEQRLSGLIETVPGAESLLYVYDPLKLDRNRLIEFISGLETRLKSINECVFETRLFQMPLAFDHSDIKKSIKKYLESINPEAFYCMNNSNLEYIAAYNGMSVGELKRRFLGTQWLVTMVGFFPGLPYYYPLSPSGALTCPKYNPARTWTPEGAVDLADYCSTIFGVESSGGYQLIGKTVPIFQAYPTHKQFTERPNLFRPTDIIQFYEAKEEEIDSAYELVKKGAWEYSIRKIDFSVAEWLAMYQSQGAAARELARMQEAGRNQTQSI